MKKKRASKKRKKSPLKTLRWLISLLVPLIIFYLVERHDLQEIQPGDPPVLYANVCHDDLEKLFVEAIQGAERSVFLVIYSLSDHKLIQALNDQASKGLSVSVIHDRTTHQTGFQKLSKKVESIPVKRSGLMHQKILVIDEEKVLLGSANMTDESLKLHDNLVVGLINHDLAHAIVAEDPFFFVNLNGQEIEFWDLPSMGHEALERVILLLDGAKKTIRVAMFTWTHPELTAAVIRAHKRGVEVQIVHDQGQASGVCEETVNQLARAGLPIQISSGLGLLHHKFAWIDEEYLINGSANWTRSAFSRNRDCFLILHPLNESQNQKMKEVWQKTFSALEAYDSGTMKEIWQKTFSTIPASFKIAA